MFWAFANSTCSLELAKCSYGLIIAFAQLGALAGSTLATMVCWKIYTPPPPFHAYPFSHSLKCLLPEICKQNRLTYMVWPSCMDLVPACAHPCV
jgi:hypothetical protein